MLRNGNKHLLQGDLGHSIVLDAQPLLVLLDQPKNLCERERLLRDLVLGPAPVDLLQLCPREVCRHELCHLAHSVLVRLDFNLEHLSETVLEVLHTAETLQAPSDHDADAATQRLALFHAVRGKDHAGSLPHFGDHVPHMSAGDWVHASAGLVEENNRRTTDQRDSQGELSLVSATVGGRHPVSEGKQTQCGNQAHNDVIELWFRDALESSKELKMLTGSHKIEQGVKLWTVSHVLSSGCQLCCHVVSIHRGLAASRVRVPSENRQGRRLAGPVNPKEPEALSPVDAQREVCDSHLGGGITTTGPDLS
mmetsp:Transcript_202/g.657  ORF Transcript_202/g.657 Transcript_202/m.657 type:complete len:308 (-) Transcript_202:5107-6030(-)